MVSLKCENDPKHYKLAHNGGSPIEKGAKGIFHIQKKLASYLSAAVAKGKSVFRLFFSIDGVTFGLIHESIRIFLHTVEIISPRAQHTPIFNYFSTKAHLPKKLFDVGLKNAC